MKKLCAVITLATLSIAGLAGAAEPDAKTTRVFQAKCASCHGEDGKGETTKGKELGLKSMATAAWQKGITDAKIKEAIENGVTAKGPGGKEAKMDGYSSKLKPEQIDALVGYVRSLGPK
jgi:mono/diheme cytochrome c family protein